MDKKIPKNVRGALSITLLNSKLVKLKIIKMKKIASKNPNSQQLYKPISKIFDI